MKKVLMLSVLLSSISAQAKLTHYYGDSELITSDGDDLVTLAVNGKVAKHLFETIKADLSNDGDGRVSKSTDAVTCNQIGVKAPYLYSCSYIFRDDGTLIQ